jgi:hypothetical protein
VCFRADGDGRQRGGRQNGRIVAAVGGLIVAVKLSRAEFREIQNGSPRVRAAITDSINIARMIIDASKGAM